MTFIATTQPSVIKHYPYRPHGYMDMVATAAHNVRLSKRAEKL